MTGTEKWTGGQRCSNEVQTEGTNWEEDTFRPSLKSPMSLTSTASQTDFINYVPNQT